MPLDAQHETNSASLRSWSRTIARANGPIRGEVQSSLTERTTQERAAAVHYTPIKTAAAIRVHQERSRGSSIDIADVHRRISLWERIRTWQTRRRRVEAEEDEARAKSGQPPPPKPSETENSPRRASFDRPKPAA
jgi:hypothetical protein